MMTTKEFIQYASERPELCEKISACTAPEEAFAIAEKEGLTDDMATFIEVMTAVKNGTVELSDDDLDQINAAGTITVTIVSTLEGAAAGAAAAGVAG